MAYVEEDRKCIHYSRFLDLFRGHPWLLISWLFDLVCHSLYSHHNIYSTPTDSSNIAKPTTKTISIIWMIGTRYKMDFCLMAEIERSDRKIHSIEFRCCGQPFRWLPSYTLRWSNALCFACLTSRVIRTHKVEKKKPFYFSTLILLWKFGLI